MNRTEGNLHYISALVFNLKIELALISNWNLDA